MEHKKGKDQSGEDQAKKGQGQNKTKDESQSKKQDGQQDPKSIKDKFKDLAGDIASETREGVDKLGKEAKKKFEELREENKDFEEKAKHVADEFATGAQEAFEELSGAKDSKRILAGVMGIIFGALGLHKFILGYTREGLIMLLVSLLSLGFLAPLMALIGLVEGIVYLSKSEEEFYNTYQAGKKPWF